MNSDVRSLASSFTINSRTASLNGQHRQIWLRGHSRAPSIDSARAATAGRRTNGSRASAGPEFEYVCPYAGCAQSFVAMSGLQQHYTQRHSLRGGAFDTPMTEPSSVQLPLRRHQQLNGSPLLGTPPRSPHVGSISSKSAVTSLIDLPLSTASSSSAECDSDSDFTDEEDGARGAGRHGVSSDVKKMIKYLLCKVQWHLYSSSIIHCASPSRAAMDPRETESSKDRPVSPSLSPRTKRRASNHSGLTNSDDGHRKKRRKVKPGSGPEAMMVCRFACPFYKYDPKLYGSRRSCPGPGWPTVHKMKEHLYRAHAEPIQCPRCYIVVETDADLRNHIRGEPCPVAEPQSMEGITREQLKTLRKRAAPCRLEEDKWMDVYQLLFPHVLGTDIPSPYYDHEMPTERSRQFRRDLLTMIRNELFSAARRATGQVEEQLLKQVAGIIQRCQRQLVSSRQATAHNTPNRTPQLSPSTDQQPYIAISSPPQGYRTPPPLQRGLLDPDSFFPGVTDDELYHVDWNALFADPHNDIPSLSTAIANSQSLSNTSRDVQMVGG